MLYMIIGDLLGLVTASILLWKRKIHFFLSLIIFSTIPLAFFIIGLHTDAHIEAKTSDDNTSGLVYAFLLYFGSIIVYIISLIFLSCLGLIQLIIDKD